MLALAMAWLQRRPNAPIKEAMISCTCSGIESQYATAAMPSVLKSFGKFGEISLNAGGAPVAGLGPTGMSD